MTTYLLLAAGLGLGLLIALRGIWNLAEHDTHDGGLPERPAPQDPQTTRR
jgi:hypothetical protein